MRRRPPAAGPEISRVNEPFPPVAADDRRLFEACAAGDPAARDEFATRFTGLIRHVVDQGAAAGEIDCPAAERAARTAAILEACLRDDAAVLRGFAGRATPETYLAVAAHRLARRLPHPSPTPIPATTTAPTTTPTRRPPGRDQLEALLTRLQPHEARLVRLHRIEGRSYGEISQLTGLPLAAIGPALARARARMDSGRTPDEA
jgi:RNA polymerase sigma-70 factor (ECF subfamily)